MSIPVNRPKYQARSRAKTRQINRYMIEGEHVTIEEMAARVGIAARTMSSRFNREKRKDGPVTWAGLEA